mgnify:CR=1 FL=1
MSAIESTLIAQARLRRTCCRAVLCLRSIEELDAEADRIGELIGARVTFIDKDGRVVGDSSEPLGALATLENHAQRPEVIDARARRLGTARRYSATVKIDMLYVASAGDRTGQWRSCASRCR